MFYIAQAGSALQVLDTAGTVVQTLTLPSGVTIDAATRGQFAILNQQIIFAHASSVTLTIDPADFTVRPLSTQPPLVLMTLAAGGGTGLTGVYKFKVSYLIKDEAGVLVYESPLSPSTATISVTNQSIDITSIPLSLSPYINGRRIYRTVAGGSVFFAMTDIDDNETTALSTTLADAALELLPEDPELGNPPGTVPGTAMQLLIAWRNRLWGKSANPSESDKILFSDFQKPYAWSLANFLLAQPVGEDAVGIVLYLARRDELVTIKQKRILKVTGTDEEDFEVIVVAEGVGGISSASGVVVRDVGYFHGPDTVYRVSDDGVLPLSNDKVDPWFKSDRYFNRALFPQSIGGYNPFTDCYELQLASLGSDVLDSWVAYDIRRKEWLGPHFTTAFECTMRALLYNNDGSSRPVMAGSDGVLYDQNQLGASDDGDAIAIDWVTKAFNGNAPTLEKFWNKPVIHVKNQGPAAGTLGLTARVGDLHTAPQTTQPVPMTADTQEMARLGSGVTAQLQFTHSTNGEDVDLRGFELPYVITGNRPRPTRN